MQGKKKAQAEFLARRRVPRNNDPSALERAGGGERDAPDKEGAMSAKNDSSSLSLLSQSPVCFIWKIAVKIHPVKDELALDDRDC